MATYYWVGGAGTWDTTATANWSTTSGGAGGAGPPTNADDVIFNAASDSGGAFTVTLGADVTVRSCTITTPDVLTTFAFGTYKIIVAGSGITVWSCATVTNFAFTGSGRVDVTNAGATTGTRTVAHGQTAGITEAKAINLYIMSGSDTVSTTAGSSYGTCYIDNGFTGTLSAVSRSVYGDFRLSTGVTTASGTATTIFKSTNATPRTVTSNGRTINFNLAFDGVGGTWELADALSLLSTRGITLTNGTLNAKSYNVTTGFFSASTGTKTLKMGSGLWTLTGSATVWSTYTGRVNFTLDVGTANILINVPAGGATFTSSTATYNKITLGPAGSSGNFTVSSGAAGQTLTINELATVWTTARAVTFTSNVGSYIINTWSLSGSSGVVHTISGSALDITVDTRATISVVNQTSGVDYLNFKNISCSNTTPVTFYAGANSTRDVNVRGIIFAAPSSTIVHVLDSGTSWTVPADWNSANNSIHLFGGGGGGATSARSGDNRAAGGGGGGGGYTLVSNYSASPGGTVTYAIGAGGDVDTDGGTTSWASGAYTAGGGGKGTAATTPTSAGGAGGTGSTYNGGSGGAGAFGTAASTGYGGGGGGGAGGPNGNGGNGGTGFGSSTSANIAAGGGGGNGGGTNGADASSGVGGNGGNNSLGTGGATTFNANGPYGTLGGGGKGGTGSNNGTSFGGPGAEIVSSFGGGGGNASAGSVGSTYTKLSANIYGGGGAGGPVSTAGVVDSPRMGGVTGGIIITYTAAGGGVSVNVTDVSATGSVGSVTVPVNVTVSPSGVDATGAVGDVAFPVNVTVSPSGVEATGSLSSVTVSTGASTSLTGVEATGSIGIPTVRAGASTALTGVEATGSVGSVDTAASANINVTGVEAAGAVGDVTVYTVSNIEVTVTGVSADAALGTVIVSIPVAVDVTGLEATGAVGDVTIYAAANDNPDGLSATGSVGSVDVIATATVDITGVEATGAVGTTTERSSYYVSGVDATASVGSVIIASAAQVSVTGVTGYGMVGTPLIWSQINDNQTPNWQPVNDSQTSTWVPVADGSTVVWTEVPK